MQCIILFSVQICLLSASIYDTPYLLSAASFLVTTPIRIVHSESSGLAMMFSPFSSASMTPEQTVKPFSPMSRLKSVALSRTMIFFGSSSELKNSSEK